jgi:hypothetical protein
MHIDASPPHRRGVDQYTPAMESHSMIRQDAMADDEAIPEERSFRIVEYAMAFIALMAAGILAFVR